ncbi:MAG TPA: hypothetical protein VF434_06900, partial [Promineifilum sp.]
MDKRPRSPHHPTLPRADLLAVAGAVLAALAAMWLYRRAVTFAFFNDDPSGHFAWMEGRSIW